MSTQKPTPSAPGDVITNKNIQGQAEKKSGRNAPEKEYKGYEDMGLLEPTRYGDWDVKGRCSDF